VSAACPQVNRFEPGFEPGQIVLTETILHVMSGAD